MFKYLLFRGIQDIRYVFSNHDAVSPEEIKAQLERANECVCHIWEDEEATFREKMAECASVVSRVIERNAPQDMEEFVGVPAELLESLARIFRETYRGENLLLVGRSDTRAYEVQEQYASEVAEQLQWSRPLHSRAITRLGKAYGLTSMPLLCIASVAGLWQLCCSPFYQRVLSLVCPPCLSSSSYR